MYAELRRAGRLAWLIVSAAVAPALVAPFVAPEQAVVAIARSCRSRAHAEQECPLCGMTHAFLRLARGDFQGATEYNRASLALFAGLTGNELTALLAILRRRRQQRIIMVDEAGD